MAPGIKTNLALLPTRNFPAQPFGEPICGGFASRAAARMRMRASLHGSSMMLETLRERAIGVEFEVGHRTVILSDAIA